MPTRSGVFKAGLRGTPQGDADTLAYLDSLWGSDKATPGHQERIVEHEQRLRLWVILARDIHNTWRVREVRAYTADLAAAKYNNIFNYEVVGVGLLGGSGHPVQWMRDGEWSKKA